MKLQRLKSQNQRDILYKFKTCPRPPKTAHLNMAPHVYITVGKICITPPKYTMKEGGTINLTVVLLLPLAKCRGDAVFHCERNSTLFGLPKRTQLEISG